MNPLTLWKRLSFRVKLIGSFLLVILVSVVTVYWFTERIVIQQFSRFTTDRFSASAEALLPVFTTYYEQNGSWTEVEQLLRPPQAPRRGNPPLRNNNPVQSYLRSFVVREGLIVADAEGVIVFALERSLLDRQIPNDVLNQGVPIMVQEQRIGTLLSGIALAQFTPLVQQFFRSLNQSTLLAAFVAVLVSLGLGALLVRQLSRPLHAVTQAAEKIASGDLDQTVEVNSSDDVGILAQTFNTMSARLKQSEHLRQQMMLDIAHELRTPVSVIQGNMEALIDGVYPANEETFQSLLEESHRLSHLIDDLRELSLLEAGELRLQKRQTDLKGLIRQLLHAFEPSAKTREITLRFDPGQSESRVLADADRIAQVLRNLLDNALRHTPQGGQVTLTLSGEKGLLICAVADTGPGIDKADVQRVFERFWRADESRARHSGGSGLGLSIAKRLVEAHGGAMWVNTVTGSGSTFSFSLPRINPTKR